MQHSSKERHPGTDAPADDCPYEHQLRVDECAEPILLFLHEVNAIYFENSSLLSDKETQVKISKGCELMREYQICVQGASTSCNPDEGVQAWRQVGVPCMDLQDWCSFIQRTHHLNRRVTTRQKRRRARQLGRVLVAAQYVT
ncbi:hypothetical protein COOONC_25901 [Cooperia oncophora]